MRSLTAYARSVNDQADPFAAAKENLYSGALPHMAKWKKGRLEKRSHDVACAQQARRPDAANDFRSKLRPQPAQVARGAAVGADAIGIGSLSGKELCD